MFDVGLITLAVNKLVNILKIVTFVCTQVLLRIRSFDNNMDDQIINRPFIMFICSSNMNCEWRSSFINQNMDFGSRFCSICRIFARFFTSQRCRNHFAVHRLPFPTDSLLSCIKFHHHFEKLIEKARSFPGLKSFMQGTAGYMKPFSIDRFPLTPCPQHIPDAINDIPIIDSWPPWPSHFRRLWKMFFEFPPKLRGDRLKINFSRFCVILFHGDAHLFDYCFSKLSFIRLRLFFQLILFFG